MLRSSLVLVLLAACSNNSNTTIDAAIGHDAARDAAVSPDATSDAAIQRHGQVAVAEGTGPNGAMSSVSATLSDVSEFGTVVATDGPCTLYQNAPSSLFSAGTITVTGTTTAITLNPTGTSPNIHYTPTPTPPLDIFTAGATITMAAAGGEFPAFSGTVTAPATLAGWTVPTTMSRAGYTASWTAGAGPKVWVIIVGSAGTANVICRVDDTGSFAVPSSTFALMPAANTMVGAAVARVAEHVITTPDVSLFAVSEVASGLIPLTP